MRHRTLDEMISYFNQQIGEMDIKHEDKIKLLGMITVIGYEAQKHKWIPCSERLPENRYCVLVTYQYKYGLIDHGITWYGEAEKKWNSSREVIAWMPLPEPYKEVEHETN